MPYAGETERCLNLDIKLCEIAMNYLEITASSRRAPLWSIHNFNEVLYVGVSPGSTLLVGVERKDKEPKI